ncbi:hypothetical protein P3S67_002342 [Capsicum chacoense]
MLGVPKLRRNPLQLFNNTSNKFSMMFAKTGKTVNRDAKSGHLMSFLAYIKNQ